MASAFGALRFTLSPGIMRVAGGCILLDQNPRDPTIFTGDLRQYFNHLLLQAAEQQRSSFSHHALNYVTELLVEFQDTARLFVQRDVRVPVLADMLNDALDADFHRRVTILRQMGDTSLMVSGFFPEALSKRAVDITYYQKMGEIAYSHLGTLSDDVNIYDELSERFIALSALINDVSEATLTRDITTEKLLDQYMTTGSDRSLERLKRQGVIPIRSAKKGTKLEF